MLYPTPLDSALICPKSPDYFHPPISIVIMGLLEKVRTPVLGLALSASASASPAFAEKIADPPAKGPPTSALKAEHGESYSLLKLPKIRSESAAGDPKQAATTANYPAPAPRAASHTAPIHTAPSHSVATHSDADPTNTAAGAPRLEASIPARTVADTLLRLADLAIVSGLIWGAKKLAQKPIDYLASRAKESPFCNRYLSLFIHDYQKNTVPIESVPEVKKAYDRGDRLVLGIQGNGHCYLVIGGVRIDGSPLRMTKISDLSDPQDKSRRMCRVWAHNKPGLADNGVYVTFELPEEIRTEVDKAEARLRESIIPGRFSIYGCTDEVFWRMESLGISPNNLEYGDRLGFTPDVALETMLQEAKSRPLFLTARDEGIRHTVHNPHGLDYGDLIKNCRGMAHQSLAVTALVGTSAYLFFSAIF